MTILYFFAIFLFILLSIVLSGVILLQEGKGGMGASFGADSADSLFGASTADVLKRFTAYTAAAFLVSCVVLSLWTEVMGRRQSFSTPSSIEQFEAE